MPKATAQPSESLKRAAKVAKNHRSSAFQDGLAMRSQVLGPDYVQRAFEGADELSLPSGVGHRVRLGQCLDA